MCMGGRSQINLPVGARWATQGEVQNAKQARDSQQQKKRPRGLAALAGAMLTANRSATGLTGGE